MVFEGLAIEDVGGRPADVSLDGPSGLGAGESGGRTGSGDGGCAGETGSFVATPEGGSEADELVSVCSFCGATVGGKMGGRRRGLRGAASSWGSLRSDIRRSVSPSVGGLNSANCFPSLSRPVNAEFGSGKQIVTAGAADCSPNKLANGRFLRQDDTRINVRRVCLCPGDERLIH